MPTAKPAGPVTFAAIAAAAQARAAAAAEKKAAASVEKVDRRGWLYCSDKQVKPATIEDVLASQAYLLFYERI